ncbi:hypothetical protein FXO38_24894 [Capsicum annuum]|nr:hypothetical protein FXO37_34994 [Capsicum annuum]KAF3634946.1 hypothetical protein FXO38_24894 [Capsicum annuum]
MILEDADLYREYGWGELSFDETISSLKSSLKPTKTTVRSLYQLVGFPYAFMKLQSTCSKKFKKILDENKSLKFELSEIKISLLGKLKADEDILSNKQPDNLHGEPSRDPMVDDQYDDPTEKRSEKKLRAEEGKNAKGHSDEKKKAAEERVTGLGPLNMEEMRQAKNQEKNARAEDLLPFPLVEKFLKSSPYSELQDLGGINNDTIDVISDVDTTTKFVNVDSTTCVVEISLGKYTYRIGYSKISKELWKRLNVDLGKVSINHDVLFILSRHLDTIFYYTRKKAKYEPNIVVKFTTTDFVFRNKNDALYYDFVENRKDFSAIPKKHEVEEYIRSFYCDANVPWNKNDCGAFVCAIAEYVIHGRDIPKEIDIGHVRMRYGAFLWDYGKRKLEAGIKDNTTEKVGRLFGKEKRKMTHNE